MLNRIVNARSIYRPMGMTEGRRTLYVWRLSVYQNETSEVQKNMSLEKQRHIWKARVFWIMSSN